MTIAACAWAKRQRTGSANRKGLLMVLADYATVIEGWDPDGSDGRHYAWPGMARLAYDTEQSERSLIRGLAELEQRGLIRRVRQHDADGHRRPDVIILAVDDDGPRPFVDKPVDTSVDDDVDNPKVPNCHLGAKVPNGARLGANGDNASLYEPPSEPPSTNTRAKKSKLPEGWLPDEELKNWARESAPGIGWQEHEKFVDYWRGNGKMMADWRATWRNWMRRAAQDSGRRPVPNGKPAGNRYPTAAERSHDRLMQERELLLQAERIVEQHGGNSEDPAQVQAVYEHLRSGSESGSATRKPDMYSDGDWINGEVVPPREVTAGEGQ